MENKEIIAVLDFWIKYKMFNQEITKVLMNASDNLKRNKTLVYPDYDRIDSMIDEHLVINPDTMTYDLDKGNIQWFVHLVFQECLNSIQHDDCSVLTSDNCSKVLERKIMDLVDDFAKFPEADVNIMAWDNLTIYHPISNNKFKKPIFLDEGLTQYERGQIDAIKKLSVKNLHEVENLIISNVNSVRHNELSIDAGAAISEAIKEIFYLYDLIPKKFDDVKDV